MSDTQKSDEACLNRDEKFNISLEFLLQRLVSDDEGTILLEISTELDEKCIEWLLSLLKNPLNKKGVELEVRYLVKNDKKLIYHVGAKIKRLIEAAELMKLKKKYTDGSVRNFNIDEFFMFAGTDDVKTIFSSKEKQMIVLHEIESIRYNESQSDVPDGLPNFYEDQSIFPCLKHKELLNFYPLHDRRELQVLQREWITGFIKRQPLDLIHSYFGDSISIYFAFLGFYTKSLIIPALLGLTFQLVALFSTEWVLAIFCIFNIIWTSIFLVFWKRKCSELAFKWGAKASSKYDEPRPEFRGTSRGHNEVTGRCEPLCNSRSKYYRFYSVSLPVMFVALLVCIVLGVVYFMLEEWINIKFSVEGKLTWLGTFLSYSLVSIYGAIIYLFDILYRKIAVKLTDYENHRVQSTYDNFLVVKLVSFNFVNYFISLFYAAFYMQDFSMLSKQLAALLITWQVIQQFQEALIPYLTYKVKKKKTLKMFQEQVGVDGDLCAHEMGKDATKEEYQSTLDDFLELWLQFGYVYLFSAVFPTAAFWGLLNNITEIRTDAFKLCYIYRRPFVTQCAGIGAWLPAFELMGILAVMTNCALVAMSATTQEHFFSVGWDSFEIVLLFVVVEHLLLFIKAVISFLVPPVPGYIKVQMDKMDYEATTAWMEKRKKELRSQGGNIIDKKLL